MDQKKKYRVSSPAVDHDVDVLRHAFGSDINKAYVYTYYGKLPASYVNDESVDYLKKFEQGKVNKVLNQYIAFCGQECLKLVLRTYKLK